MRAQRVAELGAIALGAIYVALFVWQQRFGLTDVNVMEWDARVMTLPAWRFHGTGLFENDLVVDLLAVYDTTLWKAIYWLGTLATDPITISKALPFAGLAVLVWQGWAFGRRQGDVFVAVATVILLVHCNFLWNRMMGGHSRGFGYPLMIAFLRYASERAERRTLLVLALSSIAYPSVALLAIPAYALTLWWQDRFDRVKWLRFFAVAALCGVAIVSSMWTVPAAIGTPPTMAQAATLRQMTRDGVQPYFPPYPPAVAMVDAFNISFRAYGSALWQSEQTATGFGLIATFVLLLGVARAKSPKTIVFRAALLSSFVLFVAAYVVAYRLYLPDRMLIYAWPPLLLLLLPFAVHALLQGRAPSWLGQGALVLVFLVAGGDGLPRAENMTPFHKFRTPALTFVALLPKDAMIATHPERASFVQGFALRRTLFSAGSNVPFYFEYGREMERRIDAFYRAYYAADVETLRRFAKDFGVTHLLVDRRDFGERRMERAKYFEPWTTLARSLLLAHPPELLALAHPPDEAVVYRDENQYLLDLGKLR